MLSAVASFHSTPYPGQASHTTTTAEKNLDHESKDTNSVDTDAKVSTKDLSKQLSKDDQHIIQKLKLRDQEVKAHEQAHLSAAGNIASGGASFTFTQGPNGIRYATGGEVNIDTAAVEGDPAATLRKADTIRRAALAPMSPSSQDQLVAAKATAMSNQAQADISKQIQEKQEIPEETKQKTDSATEETTDLKAEESLLMKGNILDITT